MKIDDFLQIAAGCDDLMNSLINKKLILIDILDSTVLVLVYFDNENISNIDQQNCFSISAQNIMVFRYWINQLHLNWFNLRIWYKNDAYMHSLG